MRVRVLWPAPRVSGLLKLAAHCASSQLSLKSSGVLNFYERLLKKWRILSPRPLLCGPGIFLPLHQRWVYARGELRTYNAALRHSTVLFRLAAEKAKLEIDLPGRMARSNDLPLRRGRKAATAQAVSELPARARKLSCG